MFNFPPNYIPPVGGSADTTALEVQIAALGSRIGAAATGSTVTVTTLAEAQALSGMMLFDDVEMTFNSGNVDDWQDMINALPKNGNGKLLNIYISDGTYSTNLSFTGFVGYRDFRVLSSNTANWSNSATKTVTIEGYMTFMECNCGWLHVQGLHIDSPASLAVNFERGGGHRQVYCCVLEVAVTAAEKGALTSAFSGASVSLTYTYVGGGNAGVSALMSNVALYSVTAISTNLPYWSVVSGYGSVVALSDGNWPNSSNAGQTPTTYRGGVAVPYPGKVLS